MFLESKSECNWLLCPEHVYYLDFGLPSVHRHNSALARAPLLLHPCCNSPQAENLKKQCRVWLSVHFKQIQTILATKWLVQLRGSSIGKLASQTFEVLQDIHFHRFPPEHFWQTKLQSITSATESFRQRQWTTTLPWPSKCKAGLRAMERLKPLRWPRSPGQVGFGLWISGLK